MQEPLSALDTMEAFKEWDDLCPQCGDRVLMAEFRPHYEKCKKEKKPSWPYRPRDWPHTITEAKRLEQIFARIEGHQPQ